MCIISDMLKILPAVSSRPGTGTDEKKSSGGKGGGGEARKERNNGSAPTVPTASGGEELAPAVMAMEEKDEEKKNRVGGETVVEPKARNCKLEKVVEVQYMGEVFWCLGSSGGKIRLARPGAVHKSIWREIEEVSRATVRHVEKWKLDNAKPLEENEERTYGIFVSKGMDEAAVMVAARARLGL